MTQANAARVHVGKRIAVCMDGTWQRLRTDTPTNIARIARSVQHEGADGLKQIVIYTPGVGAANDLAQNASGALAGGLFGAGLEQDVLDTYTRIALNYQWGDDLYIFGYSRGAFSARSLAGMIRRCGIVRRRYVHKAAEAFQLYRAGAKMDPDAAVYVNFRNSWGKSLFGAKHVGGAPDVPIQYMGIFDTVGQRGLPSGLGPLTEGFNKKYAFHSLSLGASVAAARHALAIDEARFAFPPTLWDNLDAMNAPYRLHTAPHDLPYQQRWFPGSHGDIGGGGEDARLADFPLAWIVEGAEAAGLAFDRTPGSPLGDALVRLDPSAPDVRARGLRALAPGEWPLRRRKILQGLKRRQTVDRGGAIEHIHLATALRIAALERLGKPYKPPNLKPFLPALRELGAVLPLLQALARIQQGGEKPGG
jgi:uncharacterized protein (DUF2235 family)